MPNCFCCRKEGGLQYKVREWTLWASETPFRGMSGESCWFSYSNSKFKMLTAQDFCKSGRSGVLRSIVANLLQVKGYTRLMWEPILPILLSKGIHCAGTVLTRRLTSIPVRGLNLHMLARPILQEGLPRYPDPSCSTSYTGGES